MDNLASVPKSSLTSNKAIGRTFNQNDLAVCVGLYPHSYLYYSAWNSRANVAVEIERRNQLIIF